MHQWGTVTQTWNKKLSRKEHFEDWNTTLKLKEIQSVILSVCLPACLSWLWPQLSLWTERYRLSVFRRIIWRQWSSLLFHTNCPLWQCMFTYTHTHTYIFPDSFYTGFQYLTIHTVNRLSRPSITRKSLDFLGLSYNDSSELGRSQEWRPSKFKVCTFTVQCFTWSQCGEQFCYHDFARRLLTTYLIFRWNHRCKKYWKPYVVAICVSLEQRPFMQMTLLCRCCNFKGSVSTAYSHEEADTNRYRLNEFFVEINLILAANFSLLNRYYPLINSLKALVSIVPIRALHVFLLLNITPRYLTWFRTWRAFGVRWDSNHINVVLWSRISMQSLLLILKDIKFL